MSLEMRDITLPAQAEVKIEASQNMDLKSDAQLNVKGSMVNIN